MCGRYTIRRPVDIAREVIGNQLDLAGLAEQQFSVSPGRPVAIVRAADAGREMATPVWGFVPKSTTSKPKFAPINAKSETVATGWMFKYAFNERRCLMPCDGFYEPKGP